MATATTKAALTPHEQFASLHADTRERLAGLAQEWAAGEWSASGFAAEMDRALLDAHTAAVVIGRSHGGDTAPEEDDDRRFAARVVESEHAYLQPFREAMERGEYTAETGVRDGDAVAQRATSYLPRLTGTANQALFLTLPEDTEVYWQCREDESSCEDCPAMEDASPWLSSEMPFHVGENRTACLFNCRCVEQIASGERGFATP